MGKPRGTTPQTKINVTSKSPVGDISVVTLIRTDTTLDHSQKAEKVWLAPVRAQGEAQHMQRPRCLRTNALCVEQFGRCPNCRHTGDPGLRPV